MVLEMFDDRKREEKARPLTAVELLEMVKKNGGKPVVVWVVSLDDGGALEFGYAGWEMFDGAAFSAVTFWTDMSNYGRTFVAFADRVEEG